MKENSAIKEKALHPEQSAAQMPVKARDEEETSTGASSASSGKVSDEPLDERLLGALQAASDKKALELVLLDLREIATFTDYFIITSGANARQVQAIADGVVEQLKLKKTRPARIEGYSGAEWVLVDYGDFIVHVFEDKARKFYDLERLWRDAARVALPAELVGDGNAGKSSLRQEL
jgi:ribosome-associated protein